MATKKKNTATNKPATKATAKNGNAKPAPSKLSALDCGAVTTDHMVHAGTEAVKDMLHASTEEAQKAQEKAFSIGQQNLEEWTRNSDENLRRFIETFGLSQEQVDAMLENSKITNNLGQELQAELLADINAHFNEQVELSKALLSCRTLNDVTEIQNQVVQSNLNHFFTQSARLTDAWLRLATDAAEVLNTQTTEASARIQKSLRP